ncbi:fluoride efflux transporter CrcB [Bacillus cereus]|uniref:fluoride efflux transporter CrcB n=1 Tax=Bacillus cereus TaxID=1396 RepID=UPI0012395887|nr:fluoride efflux transporter CrcB [Bacillus cereus]KAA6470363.1 fluoride efflux transporter CrcB [Bacillus cereus]
MVYIIVGIAGILGALSRYYLGLNIDAFWNHTFPLATLLINLIGCFVLSWITTYISRLNIFPPEIVTGIGTGFVGSFTTFSTFSVETVKLINHSEGILVILYVCFSMLGGLLMSGIGYKLGGTLFTKRAQKQSVLQSKGGTK